MPITYGEKHLTLGLQIPTIKNLISKAEFCRKPSAETVDETSEGSVTESAFHELFYE